MGATRSAVSNSLTPLSSGVAGPDVFDPTDITGLKAWYDASDASSIIHSAGVVSQWNDKSGNGNHVSQAVAGSRPSTGLATQNSLNVLSFNADRLIKTSPVVAGPSCSIFWVAKTVAPGSYQSVPINLIDNTGIAFPYNGYDNTRWGPTGAFTGAFFNTKTTLTWKLVSNKLTSGTPSSLAERVNNVAGLSGNHTGALSTTGQEIYVGGDFYDPFNGEIAELVVYTGVLSAPDETELSDYLIAKWAIV